MIIKYFDFFAFDTCSAIFGKDEVIRCLEMPCKHVKFHTVVAF